MLHAPFAVKLVGTGEESLLHPDEHLWWCKPLHRAPAAIWMGKPWRPAIKDIADGLLYGLVTAGAFGWLWPR